MSSKLIYLTLGTTLPATPGLLTLRSICLVCRASQCKQSRRAITKSCNQGMKIYHFGWVLEAELDTLEIQCGAPRLENAWKVLNPHHTWWMCTFFLLITWGDHKHHGGVATSCDVHSPATAPPKASMPQVHLGELQILHPHSKAPKSIGTSGSEEARPEREDLVCQNRMETAGCIA